MPSKPPFHKQEKIYSCVPACLRMVLLGLGVDVTEAELRKLCDSTPFGTNALKALDVARQLGFPKSRKYTLTFAELKDCLAAGHFPVVFVSLLPLDKRPDIHALVVISIDARQVSVLDPRTGERVLSHEQFNEAWQISHNFALIIER